MSGGRGGRKLGRGNRWLVLGLDQMPFSTWDSNDNVLLTQKLNSRKWYFQEKLGVTSPLLDGVMLLFIRMVPIYIQASDKWKQPCLHFGRSQWHFGFICINFITNMVKYFRSMFTHFFFMFTFFSFFAIL